MTTSPARQRGALSQMDRELEVRLRATLALLKRCPDAVTRDDAIWIMGALLAQRDRICVVLRQAHDDLESSGVGNQPVLDLMQHYAQIKQIR